MNWITLDDFNRNYLKFIIDKNKNMKIKLIITALEQWNDLQNYGNESTNILIHF